jgi:nicotinamidase-related amidase
MGSRSEVHPRILDRDRSVLLLIDLQEGYRGKLINESRVVATAAKLLGAAGLLGIPVVLTEQYPKGLGATRQELAGHLPANTARFEKTSFSCLGAPGFRGHLRELGREQVVVAGIETHVCVSQTVHDLLASGLQAHLVRDAVSARFALEDEAGFAKMLSSGAVAACLEGVLFEWLRDSRAREFKAAHQLVV